MEEGHAELMEEEKQTMNGGKKKASPESIVQTIISSNDHYVQDQPATFFSAIREAQNPMVTLISCSDSRVQPNVIISEPTNYVFEIENIGNQISPSEGSVDYGIYHLKTPILLIEGHSDCGAIKAFMQGYERETEQIKASLNPLKEALGPLTDWEPFETCLIENVQKNVDYQVEYARKKYAKLIREGSLVVIGAIYDFRNDFNRGYGRLIIININGETKPEKLATLPIFNRITPEMKNIVIGRFSRNS
ncbi:hypothetical protein JXQ70_04280 [bacterium]|nr:hypothetical protein [bacterium]